MENKVVGHECRFAIHVPSKSSDIADLHVVKEAVHYADGTIKPNLRLIKDFKRDFYVTKQSSRSYKDKPEWLDEDKLIKQECTQSDLRYKVATILGKPWSKETMKELSANPYLFGTDITSTAIIKKKYMSKYPDLVSGYSTCIYDIETDVVHGTNQIIVATVVFGKQVFTVATEFFMQGFTTPGELVHSKFNIALSKFETPRDYTLEFAIAKTPEDAVIALFNKVHEWKPDFLAIWNMNFDIPRTIETLENAGFKPADILSDPSIPKEFRFCKYKPGKNKKVTASGKVIPITPSSQWHTLHLTASFYVIDAMCAYKQIRTPPNPEEPSYALDAILKKEKMEVTKFKIDEVEGITGLKFHEVMQSRYKIEYIVYNIFDCIAVLELNEKTKDLSHSLPSFAGITDFEKYTSNPRKIHDALHYYCLENGRVISASGTVKGVDIGTLDEGEYEGENNEDEEESDEKLEALSLKNWVLTLPAHLTSEDGLKIIAEDKNLATNIRGMNFDSDCSSAYPSATDGCNVSKETTKKEIANIVGIDEAVFRMKNINLLSGPVNAVEYCTSMFNFPTLDKLSHLMEQS